MHIPIHPENQPKLLAIEIHDVVVDGHLPAKFQAKTPAVAKDVPGVFFGKRLKLPHFPRPVFQWTRESRFVTHSTLTRRADLSQRERC